MADKIIAVFFPFLKYQKRFCYFRQRSSPPRVKRRARLFAAVDETAHKTRKWTKVN